MTTITATSQTFKDDHLEFCTFRGAGVCLIIFAREEDNTVTEKHTHTQRKVIKQRKMLDPQMPALGQTAEAEQDRQPLRPGSCSGANGRNDFFPGSPSLPAAVRPFLLLSSSFMSCFSHNPFARALGRCLPFLSAPITTLTSRCRGASDLLLLTGDASPPLTFPLLLPSSPLSHHPPTLSHSAHCDLAARPMPCSCITSLCTLLPLSPSLSLSLLPLLAAAAHPLMTTSATDRQGGMGETEWCRGTDRGEDVRQRRAVLLTEVRRGGE